jgi:hypothetical protein
MCAVLVGGLSMFAASLALHVVVWRIWRPLSYRRWLPALVLIFGLPAAAVVWSLGTTATERAAMLLLHTTLATVYIIGYTLVTAFSPSVELLKLLDREVDGMPISSLQLPFLAGALTGDRIDNLTAAGLVQRNVTRLELGPRGARLTRLVLLYRHAIGLPDGEGG